MKKIVLFCGGGMSSSLLVNKMIQAAKEEGFECTIEAHGINQVAHYASDADCVLIGPQVRFRMKDVKEEIPHIPVEDIEFRSYGMMDGKKVLAQAKALMKINVPIE